MRALMVATALLYPLAAKAALPPEYQALRDLEVMIKWIESHLVVARTLKVIDFTAKTVTWGEGCTAYFVRRPQQDPRPGPAPPLVFGSASCPVD